MTELKSNGEMQAHPGFRSWRILSARRLPVEYSMRVAEAARAAAIRESVRKTGSDQLPASLHGPDTPDNQPHRHAYWLPEDRNRDGRLDHLTVYSPGGLCKIAESILDSMTEVVVNRLGICALVPVMLDTPMIGPATSWKSVTPYFGPLHAWRGATHRPKAGTGAEIQLARSLERLSESRACGLPRFTIRRSADAFDSARRFKLTRRAAKGPSHPVHGWFEIEFASPVVGPITLGFAAHFGLGQFRASAE